MSETYSNLITSKNPNPMYCEPRTGKIEFIVIHHNATTNKDVAMNTWNISSGNWTSAHYEITPNEIIGCVGENYCAYHAGGTGGTDVPKIANINQRSIGLEHVNSTGAPDWAVAKETLENSARLIVDICKRYGIPIDRGHILGHNEITATACPGGINMDKLVARAKELAGGNKPTPQPPKPSGKVRRNYRVDGLEYVNGLWQVYCQDLHKVDFNWTENGIPVSVIDKVSPATGEKTPDQVLKVGDYFNFQIASVGVVQEQTPYKGYTLSHVQLPEEFIWLFTESKEKLLFV